MGGYGSTRWRDHLKARTVGKSLILDSTMLAGVAPGKPAHGRVTMVATMAAQRFDAAWSIDYGTGGPWLLVVSAEDPGQEPLRIGLTVREMPLGGVRWYLHCPMQKPDGVVCDKRVTKLYWPIFPPFGMWCRECHGLVYDSSQRHKTMYESIVNGEFAKVWQRFRAHEALDGRRPHRAGLRSRPGPRRTS